MCNGSSCSLPLVQQCVDVPFAFTLPTGGTATVYTAATVTVDASGRITNNGPDPVTITWLLGVTPVTTLVVPAGNSAGWTVTNFNTITVTSVTPASGDVQIQPVYVA
ncbi:MAG: hypothetical protein K6T83_19705 [Alicyclobacillus sp.]|nr:hypothetical protein [Alicyclobacillus sp.]